MSNSFFTRTETPANFLCIPYLNGRCTGCTNFHPTDKELALKEFEMKKCQRICNKFNDGGCKFMHCKFLHLELNKIVVVGDSVHNSALTVLSPLHVQIMKLERIKGNLSKHKKKMGGMFVIPDEFTKFYDDTIRAINQYSRELNQNLDKIQILNHFL